VGIGVVALAVLMAVGSGAAAPAWTNTGGKGLAPFTGLVDVGGGRSLYLQCRGHGSPTVVLVAGAGGAHDEWTHAVKAKRPGAEPTPSRSAVLPRVARFTRVCAYDRPGTMLMSDERSPSTPVSQPSSARDAAADLHSLLEAADEPGPYVLVGASWGGMIVNLFARGYPDDAAGLVFVDGASQFLKETLTPEQWAAWTQLIATTPHGREAPDYELAVDDIRAGPGIPDVPAIVLTAENRWDLPLGDAGPTWPAWLDAQERLTALLHADHVRNTNSGHAIAVEHPRVVADAIRAVASA
jgi:pimeloyl-ACP methyl ester carboxylesterase